MEAKADRAPEAISAEYQFPQDASQVEVSYFELQVYTGTTKHMGGLETTEELIRLCRIGSDSYVLEVGCGVGATACYLAREFGCRVVGVDLREGMVARSKERAKKERVEDKTEFRVADAQSLPFENALFDAVLCESVATFIEDKQKVADELARVTRPGGSIGLNEEIWLQAPPAQLAEEVKKVFDIEPDLPTADDWRGMLERAGLQDIVVKPYQFDARRESTQIKRYRLDDMVRMFYRTLALYLRNPDFRAYMKKRRRAPKGAFKYMGYCLLAGRR